MYVKTALVLLIAWLFGILGVYNIGTPVHILLLLGLLFLLVAFVDRRRMV